MTKFLTNVYDTDLSLQFIPTPLLGTKTDSAQVESVRDILTRYTITGTVYGRDPSKDSYTVDIGEKANAYSPGVDDALDVPDLSYMDEMEMDDFVRENLTEVKKDDQSNDSEEKPNKQESGNDDAPGAEVNG